MKFGLTEIRIEQGVYANGRRAIIAVDTETGERYANITVNLVDAPCTCTQAYINTNNLKYNHYEALKKAGIISREPISYAQSGYYSYPLHQILIEP